VLPVELPVRHDQGASGFVERSAGHPETAPLRADPHVGRHRLRSLISRIVSVPHLRPERLHVARPWCGVDGDMLKPVEWMGSSKADPKRPHDPAQGRTGFAVYRARPGRRHRDAKPSKGLAPGVLGWSRATTATPSGPPARSGSRPPSMSCTPSGRRRGAASRPRNGSSTWSAAGRHSRDTHRGD